MAEKATRTEGQTDAPATAGAPAPTEAQATTIPLRWTPAPGNMTSIRLLPKPSGKSDYTWDEPGVVVEVDAAWYAQHELELKTIPGEEFEVVPKAASQEAAS